MLGSIILSVVFASCETNDFVSKGIQSHQESIQTTSNHISPSDAIEIAAAFCATHYGHNHSLSSRSLEDIHTLSDDQGKPYAYIVNSNGTGWVMISANKDYYPILAYSDDNRSVLDLSDTNYGFQIWLDEIYHDIKLSDQFDAQTVSSIASEWSQYTTDSQSSTSSGLPAGNSPEAIACRNRLKQLNETYYTDNWSFTTLPNVSLDIPNRVYEIADQRMIPYDYIIIGIRDVTTKTTIGPLLTTEWNQKNGFNALCPNGIRTGCVPVAMGQLMKFYRFPTNFDWDNMDDLIPTYATQYLLADIRNTVGIKESETVANAAETVAAYKKYGYQAVCKNHNKNDVISELLRVKPIHMRGYDDAEGKGHAWVCDGLNRAIPEYEYYVEYPLSDNSYSNLGETLIENPGRFGELGYTYFHMNWGWETDTATHSNGNGWYLEANPLEYNFVDRENIYVTLK